MGGFDCLQQVPSARLPRSYLSYIFDIKEHYLSLHYALIKFANLFQQKNGLCGGTVFSSQSKTLTLGHLTTIMPLFYIDTLLET